MGSEYQIFSGTQSGVTSGFTITSTWFRFRIKNLAGGDQPIVIARRS